MRVLLIEDDYAVTQSISTILKKEGMVVDTTDDGEDGLDLGKLYEYDIIILDLNLPGMNGYDVLKSLRNAKNETPVLILSGLSQKVLNSSIIAERSAHCFSAKTHSSGPIKGLHLSLYGEANAFSQVSLIESKLISLHCLSSIVHLVVPLSKTHFFQKIKVGAFVD